MAVTGLLALLDDITVILDDVAVLSKVAAQKTVGIAGDDLAVNAQGLVGLDPSRELPIVGRVALGSALNKVVLVPLALALPGAVIGPMLMVGGTFLCYEGIHKVLHKHDHADDEHHAKLIEALKTGPEAIAAVEAKKVKQAIITDVVLSAEIVAVALGSVADEPFATKALVLVVISAVMTVGIYGLVALIVKLDDIGLHLQRTGAEGSARWRAGKVMVEYTPSLMKVISVVGTAAMFLVGGGIVLHATGLQERLEHVVEGFTHNGLILGAVGTLAPFAAGVVLGLVAAGVVELVKKVVAAVRPGSPSTADDSKAH